ncbi:MAG: hypothetical protein HYY02_11805 [Chloroflexi bacterium]|nr:hypothetical protein [Chloroflexota bacterium]
MRLTLEIHPVTEMRVGDATALQGTALSLEREELRRSLLEDQRLHAVDLEIVAPGEACRFGVVFDILEPRAKEPGAGSDFPGILDPITTAGRGLTHVLRGAAVTVIDETAPPATGKIVEMSGPAGAACPYAGLHHLIVVPHLQPGLSRPTVRHALRLASVKTAVHLARAALGQEPASTEVLETAGPLETERRGLPRLAYIGQVHSRQMVAEVNEQIFYGANTDGMVPTLLHPNEWLDGAVVAGYFNMGVETYFYQNHPVILELYRWHQERRITFVGAIATVAASDNEDRARNCMMAAQQAKWALGADGVVLTKYGGGAPHADMALTARICEELGMRTAVQVNDMSRDRSAESALLFNYPEVDAIVYTGGSDTEWAAPAVARAIAGSGTAAEALAAPQQLAATRVCGVTSQQGMARLRSFVY